MKKYIVFIFSYFVSFAVTAQCDDKGNYWNQSWVSCSTSANPNPLRGASSHWLLYEFHESHYIDSSYIWNANRNGESGWGAKDVVIDYSTDGTTWKELGQYTFPKASEASNYEGFLGPVFDSVLLNKILITILSTHDGGNCASIAEVQFKINRNACYGTIDACGLCDGPGTVTWYRDADGDGLGDASNTTDACQQPEGFVKNDIDICDDGSLGWSDIAPLFEDNGCTGCHGAGATGGLDLRSYATISAGGNICKTSLLTGTKLVDIINISGYDGCGQAISFPSMNARTGNQLDAEELSKIQQWIDGGAPELCTDAVRENRILAKVYLEGLYKEGDGLTLHSGHQNLIPLTQPFQQSPWFYNGMESVSTLPMEVVDWVLLATRTAEGQVVEQTAGFINTRGELVGIDGQLGIPVRNANTYFSIHHKSHLAIMSATSYTEGIYDFTNSPDQAMGIEQQRQQGNHYMMYCGDFDGNGIINSLDFNLWKQNSASLNQYLSIDGDANSIINSLDYNLWTRNRAKIGHSPLQY